ncbi:MAG TPA: response regulator [Vicinamibacteria bacterium]|nr:response regulator [Vicinamibacteria bacterium]
MSLSGSIEDLPLLEILQVVSFCQKTGFLTVRAPEGDAGVVFETGRVVAGYTWDTPPAPGPVPEPEVRRRIADVLARLVRLREGEFAFNLSEEVLKQIGGRDLSGEMLPYGINPEELMLDLARQLDEDRRDATASLEASFSAPEAVAAEVTPPAEAVQEEALEELPLAPEEPAVPAAAPPAGGPLVLLVDDEPEVCRVVGRRLADAGFELVAAASAAHGRREMHRLATEGRPFLLVVDLGLPSESGSSFRGGLDLVQQAAELATPPPVLLMSESLDEKLRGRARRLGVSLLAFKPGLSKLDPLQYEADLRAFGDKLARDLLPRLSGRRRRRAAAAAAPPAPAAAAPAALPRELQSAIAEVEAHPDPDLVAFLLLRAARCFLPRVVLFVAKDDRLRGLAGFGAVDSADSLDLLARDLTVDPEPPSPFRDAVSLGTAWAGELPADGPVGELLDRIGPLGARQGAVIPLRAGHQTIAVMYGDGPDGATLPPIEPLVAFVDRAGRALEQALADRRTAASA